MQQSRHRWLVCALRRELRDDQDQRRRRRFRARDSSPETAETKAAAPRTVEANFMAKERRSDTKEGEVRKNRARLVDGPPLARCRGFAHRLNFVSSGLSRLDRTSAEAFGEHLPSNLIFAPLRTSSQPDRRRDHRRVRASTIMSAVCVSLRWSSHSLERSSSTYSHHRWPIRVSYSLFHPPVSSRLPSRSSRSLILDRCSALHTLWHLQHAISGEQDRLQPHDELQELTTRTSTCSRSIRPLPSSLWSGAIARRDHISSWRSISSEQRPTRRHGVLRRA